MRKILYVVIIVLAVIILADRALKVYEKVAAEKEIKAQCVANPSVTGEQYKVYAEATQFRLMPYTVFGLKPNFKSETININSLGLRGVEILKKTEGRYRIAVVGGSAVFGAPLPNDTMTFCGLLKRDLKRRYELDVDVINAGVPAFVSMQELILLEDKIIGLEPDALVIFDGFNDVLTILKRENRPNYPWWFLKIEKIYYTSATKLFLEKRLKKYRPTKLLLKWINEEKEKKRKKVYNINTEQIRFYKRNLDLMCHLAKSYGIKVILIFQPVVIYKEPLSPAEKEIINSLDPDYVQALKGMCDLAKAAMKGVAAENDVIFIDGTKFFDNTDAKIFVDQVHFDQRGNDIVASRLAKKIGSEAP